MKRNDQDAIVLDEDEMIALGMLVAVRQLEDAEEWMLWEDYPELTCEGFDELIDRVREQGNQLGVALGNFELRLDIDARFILGEVS